MPLASSRKPLAAIRDLAACRAPIKIPDKRDAFSGMTASVIAYRAHDGGGIAYCLRRFNWPACAKTSISQHPAPCSLHK